MSRQQPPQRRARGTRRAVGGSPVHGQDSGSGGPQQRGASSFRAPEPTPETPDEVSDDARREDWLSAQRPPHWG
ncbi:hypothetical protein M3E18_04565 [Kocuria sp. p3-SID1433]|uniref:hypothetical protein n=1 Tax=unclassified Kocuria TaxID=2649579 RepID=UPI0021A2E3F9|nr:MULTISPECIES: hypothetical protein [unclassified Kocuria]MCT1601207.1 hypothetical protein [Kocuria sp. p3-SID1428]MCT2179821.1 hypothetical protein [Kocuria sp. p3-SID1433]